MATLTATQPSIRRSARARYLENVYFQDGIVLTAVLTALLYLILATSLDAAGYVENMTLLVPVTMGSLALGFLMSFSRFDGFFADFRTPEIVNANDLPSAGETAAMRQYFRDRPYGLTIA